MLMQLFLYELRVFIIEYTYLILIYVFQRTNFQRQSIFLFIVHNIGCPLIKWKLIYSKK